MLRVRLVGVAAILLGALAADAARAESTPVAGSCAVRFYASSTLHDFEGDAPCASFAVQPPTAEGAYRARVEVAVADMHTGISARDKRMRQMFDAAHHPRIVAQFEHVAPDALRAAARTQASADALAFTLKIGERERRLVPLVSRWQEEPGKHASFRAAFDVSLADFGLEAPTVMGFIRVEDRVRVEVDVKLDAAPTAGAEATASS
jgi:hypothetical protein